MGPVRVLHVVLSLEPGGLENGVVNVARALDPDEFRLDVCCLERAGQFASRLPATSAVYELRKREGFSFRAVIGLARIIRKSKADVIHTHNLGNLIYGSLATGLFFRRPILHSEHGELSTSDLSPKRL